MKATARRPGLNGTGMSRAITRVAIYTRKSTDEGLDQEFNSLDAQRQAVESYVLSQRGEGWTALSERYDDGGYTGANTERPAFRRLLADVESGKVDVVAVYKIDRLSRSLLDFMRVMDLFQRHEVSFVSVTQPFNTTTPAGRMLLSILATFAQFERETIAERTRDKMAATRKKGMFTGGPPVLGYDLVNKKLVMNAAEADQVREVFKLFQDLGSVMAVVEELRTRGWTTKNGKRKAFTKETLRYLLTNPVYIGKVRYQGEIYDAPHGAIIDEDTWRTVQESLRSPAKVRWRPSGNRPGALLRGLVRCGVCESSMFPHFAAKGGRRYSSYVCKRYQKEGAKACPGSRLPARELERFVVDRIRDIGKDPSLVTETITATARELEARKPALVAELARLGKEVRRITTERENLLGAIAQGGPGVPSMVQRLGEADVELQGLQEKADAARTEMVLLENQVIDEADLRAALESFTPVWDQLFPAEQARIVQLLVEAVTYDANSGDVAITFRPGGVRVLAREGAKTE